MKKVITFFKNNPVLTVSITLGLLILLYKKWNTVKRLANQIMDKSIKIFENPLAISTWVTSKFGQRIDPVTKKVTQTHNGIDLHAPMGTPVFAPADGVAYLSISDAGGNQLVIHHTNDYKTGYAHLKSRVVSHLKPVKKGDLVAYTGNTGSHTTAAHLHFTVTNPKGVKVDPLTIFDIPLKKA